MDKINNLKIYLEKAIVAESATNGPKKEFWNREVRKTKAKIESLKK